MQADSTGAMTRRGGAPGADLPEGSGARLLDLGVRREVLEGQNVVRGQAQHLRGVERAGELAGGEHGRVERLGGLVVRDDDERGRLRGADEVGQIQRAGRGGESGDTTTPRSAAQMAAHTLKRFGVFQVREELADEGENHALLILSKHRTARVGGTGVSSRPPHFNVSRRCPRYRDERCLGQHASSGGFEMNVWTKGIMIGLMGMLPLLGGCTRHSKSEHYYLISVNVDLPYWKTAAEGFEKAAAEYAVTAEVRGPNSFDPQAEVEEFRTVVARKPAGILVSVTNSSLLAPEIDKAIAAGIPVITMDSDAPESKRLYFIGTNNLQAGRLGGQRVAAQLNGKGNVVFFTMPGQPNLEERLKGYKDAFSSYPGINVVEVFDMKGDSGLAMDKAQEYLARKGKDRIDALVCLQSSAGKDVGEAIRRAKAAGDPGRLLIAMDTDVATLQLIKDGIVDSTISQKPYTMALIGLKALDDIHHYPEKTLGADYGLDPFAPFPAFVDTGVALVDKSNLDTILTRKEAASR